MADQIKFNSVEVRSGASLMSISFWDQLLQPKNKDPPLYSTNKNPLGHVQCTLTANVQAIEKTGARVYQVSMDTLFQLSDIYKTPFRGNRSDSMRVHLHVAARYVRFTKFIDPWTKLVRSLWTCSSWMLQLSGWNRAEYSRTKRKDEEHRNFCARPPRRIQFESRTLGQQEDCRRHLDSFSDEWRNAFPRFYTSSRRDTMTLR